jgi:integrase/recombinase XerD
MALTLTQLTDDYMESVRHEQGCTRQTCYCYRSWLNSYLKWLSANGHPDEISSFSEEVLRSYQYAISKRGLRPRTVRAAFAPLRGLGAFLVRHGVSATNTALGVSLPKRDAAKRDIVTVEEARLLIAGASSLYPLKRRALGRAMIFTLTMTGVRFTEWIDLKMADVNLHDGTLLVAQGKGLKSRKLFPPPECMAVIAEWLKERDGMRCRHDYLFAYDASRRVAENGARHLLEEVKSVAGLSTHDNIKPHSLRHCFATRMLTNGANMKVIQTALGHTDIKTTAIYLHADEIETAKMALYASLEAPRPDTGKAATERKPTQAQFRRQRRETGRK